MDPAQIKDAITAYLLLTNTVKDIRNRLKQKLISLDQARNELSNAQLTFQMVIVEGNGT